MRCHTCETTLTVSAPAKINLALHIHGKRQDGYHALTSLVIGVELFDEITCTPAERPGVQLVCDDPALPTNETNLVVRAAMLLAERVVGRPGVRIELRKRIPVAAGLGGGSSDAAATLRTLNRLWHAGLPDGELAELGAPLGSDVPLFFSLPAAIVTGRGEQVQPVRLHWAGWVVLAFGGWAVSTPAVYAGWREEDRGDRSGSVADALLSCRTASALGPLLVNELEPAVFRTVPAVRELRQALADLTGHPWRISGAGSTAFALFDAAAEARRVGEAIRANGIAQRVVVVRNLRP
ncbi:MAG: 4-(cytidine 5'-diphospho)-2-C-methyl-D-erythritol kinase [Planctomycetota bacterium]